MGKWVGRVSGAAVIGFVAYGAYTYFAAGYHTRPELPEGAFFISFNSGLRAMVVDIEQERATRQYLGVPFAVPVDVEDAWSICKRASPEETEAVLAETDMAPGTRLDAVCTVEVDGTRFRRGAIFTVPRS